MGDNNGSSKILDLQPHFVAAYVCLTLYVLMDSSFWFDTMNAPSYILRGHGL